MNVQLKHVNDLWIILNNEDKNKIGEILAHAMERIEKDFPRLEQEIKK